MTRTLCIEISNLLISLLLKILLRYVTLDLLSNCQIAVKRSKYTVEHLTTFPRR